jgi:hypothetical protein
MRQSASNVSHKPEDTPQERSYERSCRRLGSWACLRSVVVLLI